MVTDMRSELRFLSLTYGDAGSYTCRATNDFLGVSRETQPAIIVVEGRDLSRLWYSQMITFSVHVHGFVING